MRQEVGDTKRFKRVTVTGISREGYACRDKQQERFEWGKAARREGCEREREEGRGETSSG